MIMMMAMPMAVMMTVDQSLGRQWFLFLHHFIAVVLLILIIYMRYGSKKFACNFLSVF